jgi:hypothetical protein
MRIQQHTWDLDEQLQEEILAAGHDCGTCGIQLGGGLRRPVTRTFAAIFRLLMDSCGRGLRYCRDNSALLSLIALGGGMGAVVFFVNGYLLSRFGRYALKIAQWLYDMARDLLSV